MRIRFTLLFLFASLLPAQDASRFLRPEEPRPSERLWRTSVTTLAIANALDIHSSWGKHELNRILAGPNQTFGGRGTLLKLAFQGGLLGAEYLVTRRRPSGKVMRALSWINFGASAGIASVAIHNYGVPR